MALIEKETLLKGLWDVVLIVLSGTVCVVGSGFVVNRALARVGVGGAPPTAPQIPGMPPVPGVPGLPGEPAGVQPNAHPEEVTPKEPEPVEEKKEKKKKKKKEGEGEKVGGGLTYPLKTTVVNLATDSDHRFAKVSITLEGQDAATIDRLKELDHQVYDSLIEILGNVRAQDVATDEGKERLKDSIRERLNRLVPDNAGVKSVYLTEFLVQ